MLSNIWLFRLQKMQLKKHYSEDRVKLLQATILSNVFLGCAAIVLFFSVGIKLAFPELMDPVSRAVFFPFDFILIAFCLVAYGLMLSGFLKIGRGLFTFATVAATLAGVMLTGGFPNSVATPCLVLSPVIAFLFYGDQFGSKLAVSMLAVVFLQWFAVAKLGVVLPDFASTASPEVNSFIVFSMVFGAILSIISVYHNRNRILHNELIDERRNLAKLANQDALTGIGNSRKFHEELDLLGQAAADDKRDFAVLFIDLDDFKIINDTYGHQAGDKVLKAVATRIENCVRDGDVVARVGGDEFAILLKPEIDLELVDKIRIRLRKIAIEPISVNGISHHIGMSIGCSNYCNCADDLSLLLKQADQSMYGDKSRKDARSLKIYNEGEQSKFAEGVEKAA